MFKKQYRVIHIANRTSTYGAIALLLILFISTGEAAALSNNGGIGWQYSGVLSELNNGSISNGSASTTFWNSSSFPAFYDGEQLWIEDDWPQPEVVDWDPFNNTNNDQLNKGHIVDLYELKYTTTKKLTDFAFDKWGKFYSIGFIGKRYFAGYESNLISNEISGGQNLDLLDKRMVYEILLDDNNVNILPVGVPINLSAGYSLIAQSIDTKVEPKQVWIVLNHNGNKIDDIVIAENGTFVYKRTYGTYPYQHVVPQIILHIDKVFGGSRNDFISIDGIFQISYPTSIKNGDHFGVMGVDSIVNNTMRVDNKYNAFRLNPGDIDIYTGNTYSLFFKVLNDTDLLFYPYTNGTPQSLKLNITQIYINRSEIKTWDLEQGYAISANEIDRSGSIAWLSFWKGESLVKNIFITTRTNFSYQESKDTINISAEGIFKGKNYSIVKLNANQNSNNTPLLINKKQSLNASDGGPMNVSLISQKIGSWNLSDGYSIKAVDIAQRTDNAWIVLEKNGAYADDIIISSGQNQNRSLKSLNGQTIVRISKCKVFGGKSINAVALTLNQYSENGNGSILNDITRIIGVDENYPNFYEGWSLSALDIDVRTTPRKALLALIKENKTMFIDIVSQNTNININSSFEYTQNNKIIFFANLDYIFAGAKTDIVLLKYIYFYSDIYEFAVITLGTVGGTSSEKRTITVGNTWDFSPLYPLFVEINNPLNKTEFLNGETVSLSSYIIGGVPPYSITWSNSNGTIGHDNSFRSSSLDIGTHKIKVIVNDSKGSTASDEIYIAIYPSNRNHIYVNKSGSADYTTIYAAMNSAEVGDIIHVASGTYNEELTIDKDQMITLIAENKNSIIDGNIYLKSKSNQIDGFTIKKCISVNVDFNKLINNTVNGNCFNIYSSDNYIGNNIIDNSNGLWIYNSDNYIFNNTIINNNIGIYIIDVDNNTLIANKFSNNKYGLKTRGKKNILSNNEFLNNEYGIYSISYYESITSNNFYNNSYGIFLSSDSNNPNTVFNRIFDNNFSFNDIGIEINNSSYYNYSLAFFTF